MTTLTLEADLADALGIPEDEAGVLIADSCGGGIRPPARRCPTCGWDDAEHLPGEFGDNCPYE